MTTQSAVKQPYIHKYSHIEQLPDPPKRDMLQEETMYDFYSMIKPHFAHRKGVLISGAGYLRRTVGEQGDFVPDGVFVDGVEDPGAIIWRNGYVIDEVGKPPAFVLEIGSRSTGKRDYTVKRDGYARLGVGEYWRFDPSGGKFHDTHISGDLLVDGEYVPIEIVIEPDGRRWGYSEALGLELWWDNKKLRLRDPVAGEFLPTPEETAEAYELAQKRAEFAERRAEFAEDIAESERAARQSAERRLAEAQAELSRLRRERQG